MKRSEALSYIKDMFRLYRLENLSDEESAKRMLDFIERLGMKPPTFTKPLHIVNGLAYTHYVVNEWEKED